jgi:Uma2 family endonuclease
MDNTTTPVELDKWPDHTELPCEDGAIVENFQEHPQAMLLTDAFRPVAPHLFPDGQFAIGQNSGIYFRRTDPPLQGCKAPDWFLVPGVPPLLDGAIRRSYVMWQERVHPLVLLEFVSGDGSEERDRTPLTGKFWVYEHDVQPLYYGIYEVDPGRIEMYHFVEDHFERMEPNQHGRYLIEPLGLELGIWPGWYQDMDLPWMRWWDTSGNLLPTGWESSAAERKRTELEKQRAEREKQRAELEKQRAEQERRRAELEKQRAELEKQRAEQEKQRAEREEQRAEQEKQRAEQEKQRAEQLAERLRALGVDPNSV